MANSDEHDNTFLMVQKGYPEAREKLFNIFIDIYEGVGLKSSDPKKDDSKEQPGILVLFFEVIALREESEGSPEDWMECVDLIEQKCRTRTEEACAEWSAPDIDDHTVKAMTKNWANDLTGIIEKAIKGEYEDEQMSEDSESEK